MKRLVILFALAGLCLMHTVAAGESSLTPWPEHYRPNRARLSLKHYQPKNGSSSPYYFNKVRLGFSQNDKLKGKLQFTPKIELENQMLKSIPGRYQQDAGHFVRPILLLAEKYQIDPFWVFSVMWTESHFKDDVTSPKGAGGLMQIMPKTREFLLSQVQVKGLILEADKGPAHLRVVVPHYHLIRNKARLKHNLVNIELGTLYLKKLLREFKGNHFLATVAYNMGPDWTKKGIEGGLEVSKDHDYLNKVIKHYGHLVYRFERGVRIP